MIIASSNVFSSLFALSLAWMNQGDATNYSGLKGQELKPSSLNVGNIRNLNDVLSAGSRLLGKKSKDGKIETVSVLEDRRDTLKLKISYKDLKQDGQTLSVFISEDGVRPNGQFVTGTVNLTNKEGEATATVKLAPEVAGGTELQSKYVVVTIGKGSTLNVAVNQSFEANKNWKKRETEVQAIPVGAAQSVPATAPSAGTPSTGVGTPRIGKSSLYKVRPTVASGPIIYKPNSSIILTPTKVPNPQPSQPTTQPSSSPSTVKTVMLNPSLINFANLKPIGAVQGLPQEVKDSGGRGPDLQKGIPLFDDFASDLDNLRPDQAIDLFPMVFEDANAASNTYYYLPKSYKLAWDRDKGYGFKFLYGAQRGDSPDTVTIAARVTSAVTQSDLNLLKSTLEAWCSANGRPAPKLRPFPILNAPVCTLKGELARYNIPDDKVFVVEGAPDASEFNIAITTDTVTKENIQLAMTEGVGLNGFVKFKSGESNDVNIPLTIKFGDRGSFGTRIFSRSVTSANRIPFANPSPVPVRLDYLHILRKVGNAYRVLSYSLNQAEVPAGETSTLLTDRIPGWLDSNADTKRMWIDYTVLEDDEATNAAIKDATGGVSSMTQGDITFTTLTPLADTGVKFVLLEVKSKYFDSRASAESTKTILIDKDGAPFKIGPLFLVNRQAGEAKPGDPLFQYRMKLVFADGREKQGRTWVEASDLNLFLGKIQLQKVLDEPEN